MPEEGQLRAVIARLEGFLNGPLRLNQAPLTHGQVDDILRELLHAPVFPDVAAHFAAVVTFQLFLTTGLLIGNMNWVEGADAQNIEVGRQVVMAILNAANARLGVGGARGTRGARGGRAAPWGDLDELLDLKDRFQEEIFVFANSPPMDEAQVRGRIRNALIARPEESADIIERVSREAKFGYAPFAPGQSMANNARGEAYLFQIIQKIEDWIRRYHPAPPQVLAPVLPQELHGLFGQGEPDEDMDIHPASTMPEGFQGSFPSMEEQHRAKAGQVVGRLHLLFAHFNPTQTQLNSPQNSLEYFRGLLKWFLEMLPDDLKGWFAHWYAHIDPVLPNFNYHGPTNYARMENFLEGMERALRRVASPQPGGVRTDTEDETEEIGGRAPDPLDNQENIWGENEMSEDEGDDMPMLDPEDVVTARQAILDEIVEFRKLGPVNAGDLDDRWEAFLGRQAPGVRNVMEYYRNTHDYMPEFTEDRTIANANNYWNWLDGMADRMDDAPYSDTESEGTADTLENDDDSMTGGIAPFLCRVGSKRRFAELLSFIAPPHTTYVEPFVGSGAFYWAKEPAAKEVINDLDEAIAKPFRLIKSAPTDLSKYPKGINTLEKMKAFFLSSRAQSTPANQLTYWLIRHCGGWMGTEVNSNTGLVKRAFDPMRKLKHIAEYKARMKNTKVESKDYVQVIKENNKPSTFFFLDPPYEEAKGLSYVKGSETFDFQRLKKAVDSIKGHWLMTINDSPEIRSTFKGYTMNPIVIKGHKSNRPGSTPFHVGSKDRPELLISNYELPKGWKEHTGKYVGAGTHRANFVKANKLEDKGYSLSQLAKVSAVPIKTLKQVYSRGIGAYSTQPTSVRLKGSFMKGVKAPMSKKLSPQQWAMARVYSFLDGNPKHDNDLRRGAGNCKSTPSEKCPKVAPAPAPAREPTAEEYDTLWGRIGEHFVKKHSGLMSDAEETVAINSLVAYAKSIGMVFHEFSDMVDKVYEEFEYSVKQVRGQEPPMLDERLDTTSTLDRNE